jgi:hypothetical protein
MSQSLKSLFAEVIHPHAAAVKQMVAEKYNLDVNKTDITVSHYAGDQREPSYTTIIVTCKI